MTFAKQNPDGTFTLTAPTWLLISILTIGGSGVTSSALTYGTQSEIRALASDPSARPDPYTGSMAKTDQEKNQRERDALERRFVDRMAGLETRNEARYEQIHRMLVLLTERVDRLVERRQER